MQRSLQEVNVDAGSSQHSLLATMCFPIQYGPTVVWPECIIIVVMSLAIHTKQTSSKCAIRHVNGHLCVLFLYSVPVRCV